jgi:hydroxymethylglutaryl-CoA synthase
MEQKFEKTLYQNATVDFTFACIGGVDAMQNCIDYVTLNQKKAIVVTTDLAKYEIQQENIQLPALLCSSLQIHAS